MVFNGIDCIDKYEKIFKGKRIGLITSPSGLDCKLNSTINILHNKYGLAALFSPEHGVRGDIEAGAFVETYQDRYIDIPVHSLYRKDSKRFTEEMLECVDLVVYDIQDVGTRYFTFIYTLLYAMEDCTKYGKEIVILDRINPLDGVTVEGNILKNDFHSFVGAFPLCMRYGLTVGEFAKMADSQLKLSSNFYVIPCEGWNRNMMFPETGRLWIMPTMGIPRFESALLYPGTCLFEGTNISEGRGTTCPFEVIGAPFIDAQRLADSMNKKGLPGVLFRPVYFKPTTSKFMHQQCGGVQIHITDYKKVLAVNTGIELLFEIRNSYGESFEFLPPFKGGSRQFIDLLGGDDRLRKRDISKEELLESYKQESSEFCEIKQEFHLY
jgi:uncharacterized protein YbbC (DUF1343 family)